MMPNTLFLRLAAPILLVVTVSYAQSASDQGLETGFRLLYELKFGEARSIFRAWQKTHSEDALGPAAEAATYLFEEFYRKGVLTSEFFLDDRGLLDGIEGEPDPKLVEAFLESIVRSEDLASERLKVHPKDTGALYVLTITAGMQGNYAGVIEKRHLRSLEYTQKAEVYAKKLLSLKPDSQDVYVALGASNYIIGCLPGYKKFFLFFGGIHGDRQEGMRQLAMAAARGRYLRPFAKTLLALAALREKQADLARVQLEELATEFPQNPLFARELSLLDSRSKKLSTSP